VTAGIDDIPGSGTQHGVSEQNMRRDTMSKSFRNRPFWRDWVLGGVFIGVGFMVYAPGHPLINVAGAALMLTGVAIFVAAFTHAVCSVFVIERAHFHRRRRAAQRDEAENR
jgi:hypothetical protein